MNDLLDNVLRQLDEQPQEEPPKASRASADQASSDDEHPVIEHDVDLFDEMNSRAVQPTDPGRGPDGSEEDLQLITDPRRLAGESSASSGRPTSSGVRPVSGWSGPVPNVKVLEVPMTLDADALEDGKNLRIVLNITVRR